jgi:hypothetical protein
MNGILPTKKAKRRANLLYRLRKKGVRCNTKERTIYYPYGCTPDECQIQRLRHEFNFAVQFELT